MSRIEYCAGFFDGEGCISFEKVKNKGYIEFRLRCITSQKFDDRPLEMLQLIWGGTITELQSGVTQHVINGTKAIAMLKDMMPYLLVKREQAELAISFPNLSAEEREITFVKMKELKKTKFLGA